MCSPTPRPGNNHAGKLFETDAFKAYWYSGKAELNAYKLDQSRYGESRDGSAVLIFVTEDFSRREHVKIDNPSGAGDDKINVMKMNFTKNFVTGIYPYSMMLSVFKPIGGDLYPHAMKAVMSSQEWCGQVFSEMNLSGDQYEFIGHSYFEKEGEEKFELEAAWLEDELWNQIRLEPMDLPIGEVKIIPGLFFSRLKHTTQRPLLATVSRSEEGGRVAYTVSLVQQKRQLVIFYQQEFPHKILGWDETFEEDGKTLLSSAVLEKTMMVDYWTKNRNEFQYLRDSLGLSRHNF